MSLDKIGLGFGTDKASSHHDYLKIYEKQIPQLHEGSLLELGWLDGASMRMWRSWLHSGWTVTGLDNVQKDPIYGVNFVLGEQDDPHAIEAVSQYGPFDVIIDDASHISLKTIVSIELLWPHLKPGGVYFIEDLGTSYLPHWGGSPDPDTTDQWTIMRYLRARADDVQRVHRDAFPVVKLKHLAFWPGLCMLQKES